MPDENQYRGAFDTINADAVCEDCGTVNPEGALLCKQCGNNLRDQRARRIANETTKAMGDGGLRTRDWVRGIGVTLGLLLIVWSAFNSDRVVGWFTPAIQEDSPQEDFWNGDDSSAFNDLQRELMQNPVTESSPRLPQLSPDRAKVGDGRYAIELLGEGSQTPVFVGGGIARKADNGDLLFVARLQGDVEIRGRATVEENGSAASMDSAVRIRGREAGAFGYIQPAATGDSLTCVGQIKSADERHTATLYRLE